VGKWRRRTKSQPAKNRTKSKVSHKSSQSVSQKLVSQPKVGLAATIVWASGVDERSPSQPKTETSRKSAICRVSQSARNQSVPWRPQLGGSVASSKEVQVSRKAKQVESQREFETVSQPETSHSAESALAATII